MSLDPTPPRVPWLKRPLIGSVVAAVMFGSLMAGDAGADPAADALARMNELSRQAEQTSDAMYSAQLDLDAKLTAQQAADRKHGADQAAVDAANFELSKYQAAVDKVAAATYMGGRTDGITGVLTAGSPQQLIDQLTVQRIVSTQMTEALTAFRSAGRTAAAASKRSADSAQQARAVAEQAAALRADLQAKQSELQRKIAAAMAQYEALTPGQRAALADPGPPPPPAATVPAPTDPASVAMPGQPPVQAAPPGGSAPGGNSAVVQAALTRLGAPYSWGATGPDAFDCSGLIKWAFLQNGKSLPRTSQSLAQGGTAVAVADMQLGDIVTFYSDVSHAGIYIGDGMMVHASTYGTPVKVSPISNAPINNVRRY